VPGVIAATAMGSDWNAGGSIMTFFAPVGLFVVIAAILVLLLSRPHRRVPARRVLAPAHGAAAPGPDAARAAAVAGGLPTAAGGGGTESGLEPAGAPAAAEADAESGQGGPPDDPGQPGHDTSGPAGTEAGA
jgi:hypothetical protein